MVIGKMANMVKSAIGTKGPDDKSNEALNQADAQEVKAPVSRAAQEAAAKPQRPAPVQLNIGPHTQLLSPKDAEDKLVQQILSSYDQGKEIKAKDGQNETTTAFRDTNGDEFLAVIPASVSSRRVTDDSWWGSLKTFFSKFKVNTALKRLDAKLEIDFIADDNEITSKALLKKMTKAGVYSFVAFHSKDEAGKFQADSDLLVPVMDLENMLKYLDKNPPKGIKADKNALKDFRADIAKLLADPKLKNVKFVDEALAREATKAKYGQEDQLRKAMCCVADILDKNNEVFFSTDLVGGGKTEAVANGKEYQVIEDYTYPVVSQDPNNKQVHAVKHPLTIVRSEDRKKEPLPLEQINRVLQWHYLTQLEDVSKIDQKEASPVFTEIFRNNADAIKKFDESLATSA